MRRVVITGLGMVAPTGSCVEECWSSAIEALSGIRPITLFDPKELKVKIAGEVKNFDPSHILDIKEQRKLTRFVQFAVVASQEAFIDSGIEVASRAHRVGCSIGVGMGALDAIEASTRILDEKGERRISPFFIPFTIANMGAGYVSIHLGLKGPNMCPTTACSSGSHAIGEAFRYIQSGMADAMVCGGAESTISPLGISSFTALKALSTSNDDPATASRPFDLDRDGFVMGEGAGILVLEEYEAAKKRGAKIYAEIVGYGLSGDAHHITSPSPQGEGGQRCMKMALDSAGLAPSDIDYINAHGTSTKLNDWYETQAIEGVFGSHSKRVSISSTKGVTGHCIGAAGGIEAIYTALAIHHSVVPPTANYQTPDPDCHLDYTPNHAREKKIKAALSNSFGFGGTNATLAFRAIN